MYVAAWRRRSLANEFVRFSPKKRDPRLEPTNPACPEMNQRPSKYPKLAPMHRPKSRPCLQPPSQSHSCASRTRLWQELTKCGLRNRFPIIPTQTFCLMLHRKIQWRRKRLVGGPLTSSQSESDQQ